MNPDSSDSARSSARSISLSKCVFRPKVSAQLLFGSKAKCAYKTPKKMERFATTSLSTETLETEKPLG